MKTRLSILILLVSALGPLGGCTFSRLQIGAPLHGGVEKNLYTGQEKAEVLERLGPPDRVTMSWGEPIFEYLYREKLDRELELSFFQANFDYEQTWQQSDRLVIRFDKRGRVHDYGINLETRREDE